MKTKPQRGDIIDRAVSGMGLMHKVFFLPGNNVFKNRNRKAHEELRKERKEN